MKIIWLCNMAPGPVQKAGKGKKGGLWMDHVLTDLRKKDVELLLLFPGEQIARGQLDEACSWQSFPRKRPQDVLPEAKSLFLQALQSFRPDVIHIWGTEFGHTLSMMEACEELGLLDRAVISIQGLCSIYARHYLEGIPYPALKKATVRDLLRNDRMINQQETFRRRGVNEEKALKLARHVIGRTHWDRACMDLLAPQAEYHLCCETLREDFYEGCWQYADCSRHRIFASNRVYPIKGFHYLLEALAQLLPRYPDAVLAVPGKNPVASGLQGKLRQDGYARYLEQLITRYGLKDHVEYLGSLSGAEMKQQYLQANVFVLPSTIENSPNSLGEAMLLGVPSVAADVGGVTTMMVSGQEGCIYQSTAPYMLAQGIDHVFALGQEAERMGGCARAHALKTHDAEKNLRTLLAIYESLAGKDEKI